MVAEHQGEKTLGLFDLEEMEFVHPEQTRLAIMVAAYREIHEKGFQAASLSNILKHTGLTKGALYHHFPSKKELGYAVVDELVAEKIRQDWQVPLESAPDPIEMLVQIIEMSAVAINERDIELGCPCNNLSQEMSPIDEGFRQRLQSIMNQWQETIASALKKGQDTGHVRLDIDPESMGVMIVATLEGCMGLAKNAQNRDVLLKCGGSVIHILNSLRRT